MNRIFVFGYSHPVGGASGEFVGALSVWRKAGIMPTLVPTWGDPGEEQRKWDAFGYTTLNVPRDIPGGIKKIPGLPGAIVIAFCNGHAILHDTYKTLKGMGVRFIWVPTMRFASLHEAESFAANGLPDIIVYQTVGQREAYEESLASQITIPLEEIKARGRLIRAGFDFEAWTFQPREHHRPDPFVIGKAARPDPSKWNVRHWEILERVPYAARMSLVMGVNPETVKFSTPKPDWAEWIKPNGVPIRKYLGMIHAMVPLNPPSTPENFPRITLEAYAHGVSMVAPRNSGWCEQIIPNETGYLCDNDDETAFKVAELIYYPEKRMKMLQRAREYLTDELCAPGPILDAWLSVFHELA